MYQATAQNIPGSGLQIDWLAREKDSFGALYLSYRFWKGSYPYQAKKPLSLLTSSIGQAYAWQCFEQSCWIKNARRAFGSHARQASADAVKRKS